jgi:raffinose/stachyose/melibiose transport system substrate-binding protein
MKKAIPFLAVLLLLSAAALFAAGQKEATGEEVITLSLYEYSDLADETDVKNTKILFDTFYAKYPNIRFDIEYGFDEPYHDKLQAMLVADQLADVMFLWPGKRTGTVTRSGKIKDLRPWIQGHEDEFAPIAMAAQGPNGEIYELPEQVTATHVMFTNEKLMKNLGLSFPKTHAQLLAQGNKIKGVNLIPIAMTNKSQWQMQSCLLSALTERAGGMDWYRRVIVGDNASFADPEFVNALKVIDELSKREMFSPGINQLDYGQALTQFETEEAVYYIDGGWRANNLVSELTVEQKPYMVLNTYPDIPEQKGTSGSTAAVAGTGYGMHAKLEGDRAEAAWKWIWFYSGPEGSRIRQGFGANPAYKLPTPPDADPMIKKLVEFVGETPAGFVIDAVMDAEGMGILHPALQEMMLGKKTPRQVAEEYEAWVAANDSSRK